MTHMAHVVATPDGSVIGAGRLDPLQRGFGPFERLYEASDDMVCVVAYTDADRAGVCAALGVDRIDDDYRQADALAAAIHAGTADEAVAALRANGVAAVRPVGRNVHTLMNDPDERRIGRVAELPHPDKGMVREPHVLLRVSGAEQVPHRLAPAFGEHTDEILGELGFDADEIAALHADDAIR
jgi:crotonobetainyl-CoA:carnitine CoA-transferase CaiB-like acyl-CoA transferase